jgi:hypothetical protein
MEDRRVEPNDPSAQQIRQGWSFGAEDFIARLFDRMPGSVSEHHQARERNQTDEQKAAAIVSARLKKLGWRKADLGARRKSDAHKVALARELRSQTTMSLKWIAQRLEMGSWTHVSNLLRQKVICFVSKVRTDPFLIPQPQLHPALLRLSAMISRYFTH